MIIIKNNKIGYLIYFCHKIKKLYDYVAVKISENEAMEGE